ncbi:serine/threonine protein phosphatase 2A 55 kDa regulatory subunit B beta isoform-like isoform X2 [Primulina eburnea]|uniref:serine/threonine protein phosphatase 2A 55 kDa regulatory subunit B beta isoform-like isoform X2 n=1 Tax=Primulina eburnea TaxID=1245227 RepID=UPI003C6C9950
MSFSFSSSDVSSLAVSDWKLSQIFGDKLPGEEVQNIDIITAVQFDKSGNHLAVGDRGGRVVIFEKTDGKEESLKGTSREEFEKTDVVVSRYPKFRYKTEFQSHEPEFDYLKSIEIEENIKKMRQVKEHKLKQVKKMDISQHISSENSLLGERSFINGESEYIANGHSLEWKENTVNGVSSFNGVHAKLSCLADSTRAICRKVYAHAHDFNTNSISINSDGETFISADDLRINLWNLEISKQCFNIIDMKPENMEALTEVITSAEFHPYHCNLMAYSSSRGFVRLVDMRLSALCDHSAKILKEEESHGPKSFFTEIIAAITDLKFANGGRHILCRDFMNLKLWDMRMDTRPVATYRIHEHLRPKLCDMYNNDAIFDKFDCCLAGDRLNFATGSYSNHLRIFSYGIGSEEGTTIEVGKNPNRKSLLQPSSRLRRSSLSNLNRGFSRQGSNEFGFDFNSKLLHMAWNPTTNLIACAAGNTLLMYHHA